MPGNLRRDLLFWVIYALDAPFAGLMYLTATFATGEARNPHCLCDGEFWYAQAARYWKNLLGDATVPPSRSFCMAMAPFTRSLALTQPVIQASDPALKSSPRSSMPPVLSWNTRSAFLVLVTLQAQVFNFHKNVCLLDLSSSKRRIR